MKTFTFLKDIIVHNSTLNSSLNIKHLGLREVVFSLNQFIAIVSLIKKEKLKIFIQVTDTDRLVYYKQVLDFLKSEKDQDFIIFGTDRELIAKSNKKNHGIGMVILFDSNRRQAHIMKHLLQKKIYLFSCTFLSCYTKEGFFLDRYLIPFNNISDNKNLFTFLLLMSVV